MNSGYAHRNDECLALIDEALRNWPAQHGYAMAEELAALCEQLARLMQSADPAQIDSELPEPESNDPVESVRRNFVYGSTLLALAQKTNEHFAAVAAARLASALALARRFLPQEIPAIKLQLCRAEHLVALYGNAAAQSLAPVEI